ncbi:MAG: DUF2283 domain-containing protein [Polyangiaceae bacterium]
MHSSGTRVGASKLVEPAETIVDSARPDRLIVPGFGSGGAVAYQVKNGVLKLKKVLTWKPPKRHINVTWQAVAERLRQGFDPRAREVVVRRTVVSFEVSEEDDDGDVVAYLSVVDRATETVKVVRQVTLRSLGIQYYGPDLYFDFDESGKLVGVEILE